MPIQRAMNACPVRYGMRTRAVSPPPPGGGRVRYRVTSGCWAAGPTLCDDATIADCSESTIMQAKKLGVSVPRVPPLSATHPINSVDIISCANRMDTVAIGVGVSDSDQRLQTVRDHVLYGGSGKCQLLKKRCALVRPQVYGTRSTPEQESATNVVTLDRLPRFRFGGNRASTADKRYRDLTDRLKRSAPVPPPRNRHSARSTPQTSPTPPEDTTPSDYSERLAPFRSSSFSQVDYCSDNNKYVKRVPSFESANKETSTLPRSKNSRPTTPTPDPLFVVEVTDSDGNRSNAPEPLKKTTNNDKKRDKSRRRKGIYISQWPNNYSATDDVIPQFVEDVQEANSRLLQDSIVEISKLQNPECVWDSPKEPPSPEDSECMPKWPTQKSSDVKANTKQNVSIFRTDSLSEGEPDACETRSDQVSLVPSDISDCESRVSASTEPTSPVPRRYSKRPLRGPYGQMLEAEMKKPEARKNIGSDLKFLEDLSSLAIEGSRTELNNSFDDGGHLQSTKPPNQRKISADSLIVPNDSKKVVVSHQRTTSSPSKLQDYSSTEASSELLEQLLRGSSEQLAANDAQQHKNDTRTHVVVELYDNEKSYVDSLETLVRKYLEPLKAPENANLLEPASVDEIFSQIPFLLKQHQNFLSELKKRLDHWDIRQKIGDVFLDLFSKPEVIEGYTIYVNNWKRVREVLKTAQQSKPAFSKFLEATARQHTGKLALDALLIKPIQKFPKYELLLQRLLKHTDQHHPDHSILLAAHKLVHDQLLKINCTEKETVELDQLREIEGLVDGLLDLAIPERQFLRHDSVTISYCAGPRKERAVFLFSDILLITGIKRRSGTMKRPITNQGSITSHLEANKYKLLMRLPLEDIEIVRPKDDTYQKIILEVDNLTEDIAVLNQVNELIWNLHCNHSHLEDLLKDMLGSLHRQLNEQQSSDSQLACLELSFQSPNGPENLSIVFSNAEKRTSWEESFTDAKQKLAMSGDRRLAPEIMSAVPIRKTRAGLQFTCAAPTLEENRKDVWVCNSDGYVGQLCVLSLTPEPNVTSCNGVCNARILCISSVPGQKTGRSTPSQSGRSSGHSRIQRRLKTMHFDSSSSSEEEDEAGRVEEPHTSSETDKGDEESDKQPSTMWLGTEDGCIHVYNSTDNIRIKKNKIKLQLGSAVLSIVHVDNRVFVSLANGDITIYERDSNGGWNTGNPCTLTVGTLSVPVSKMVPGVGKLWCICGCLIKILNTNSMIVENSFTVSNDAYKPVVCTILSGNGVWLSLQNTAILKCYHVTTFELIYEINVAPAVTKMLTGCDDIIRQHKAACLRITALVTCKDLLWIGTSAGVVLTMPLPHISGTASSKVTVIPPVTGVPQGHTGHVRFLTSVEVPVMEAIPKKPIWKGKEKRTPSITARKHLVISGGDGYEDFRSSNLSEVAGREDSTNHLLLWTV